MSAPAFPLTGGCGCGAVRFEITEPLVSAVYCHCTRCQRRTGIDHGGGAQIAPGSMTVTQGEELLHGWQPEGAMAKEFCTRCGSAVLVRNPETREIAAVRLGTIDGDPGIRPHAHQYVAYAAPWSAIPDDGLPRFDERAGEGTPH